MGEKKEETKAKGVDKKNKAGEKTTRDDDGGKKDEGIVTNNTIVLKLDLHCEGCAKKVKRAIHHFEGVEDVKADFSSGKLTVKGNVEPFWLMERVANKTKKKVELLSAQPKKDVTATVGDKMSNVKVEKKAEEKKADDKKSKEPQLDTVVLKIRLHCDGCAQKVKRIIQKIEGVQEVSSSLEKDLVTVKGTMDIEELTLYLKTKLKRNVDILLPKKDDGGGSKGSTNKYDDGETKVACSEGGKSKNTELKEQKTQVLNKMEYYGHNANTHYAMPMYNQHYMDQDYGVAMQFHGYGHTGYVPPPPPPAYVNAPQMFSDENPNGCSVM